MNDPIDLDGLLAAAKLATQGEWELRNHGVIVGGPVQHYTNGSGRNQIVMAVGASEWMRDDERDANAAFIARANPSVITAVVEETLSLRKRLQQAESMLRELEDRARGLSVPSIDGTTTACEAPGEDIAMQSGSGG